MNQEPPDRSWVEFDTRREVPSAAFMYGPLMLLLCIIALVVVCHV